MRIIAFINDGSVIGEILGHLCEPTSAPRIAPARSPPLWELPVAGQAEREANRRHNRCRTTSSISSSLGRGETTKTKA